MCKPAPQSARKGLVVTVETTAPSGWVLTDSGGGSTAVFADLNSALDHKHRLARNWRTADPLAGTTYGSEHGGWDRLDDQSRKTYFDLHVRAQAIYPTGTPDVAPNAVRRVYSRRDLAEVFDLLGYPGQTDAHPAALMRFDPEGFEARLDEMFTRYVADSTSMDPDLVQRAQSLLPVTVYARRSGAQVRIIDTTRPGHCAA